MLEQNHRRKEVTVSHLTLSFDFAMRLGICKYVLNVHLKCLLLLPLDYPINQNVFFCLHIYIFRLYL